MPVEKKEVEYLIHLLSCALNGSEPRTQEGINYSALLSLARKQQIYNIIFPLIKDNPNVPEKQQQRFRDYNLSEISRMLVINNERKAIYDELDKNCIKYMPLKGLIIKDYYPKESMRQMSDNDLLFDDSFRDKVADIMKSMDYKVVATGENSDDYHKPPFCTFEFHRTLFFKNAEFCPEFNNLWENATKDEQRPYMYRMGIDDVYIYSVCHMYKHYSTAGCGIRFLADNYLLLKKEQDKLNWKYIDDFLVCCGIQEFEKNCRTLAFKIFEKKELDNDELALLEVFINNGIYGSHQIGLAKAVDKFNDGDIKKAKKKYIMYRLFPPKEKMIADYRKLEKKPYLLPAYYIYRLFKGIRKSSSVKKEISSVNDIETE